MKSYEDPAVGSGFNAIIFCVGIVVLGVTFGLNVAAAVGCLSFAAIGELQRKANQILEKLQERDR